MTDYFESNDIFAEQNVANDHQSICTTSIIIGNIFLQDSYVYLNLYISHYIFKVTDVLNITRYKLKR